MKRLQNILSRESLVTLLVAVVGLVILLATRSEGSDAGTILGRYSLRYMAVIVAYGVIMLLGAVAVSLPLYRVPAWVYNVAAAIGLLVAGVLTLLDHTWWLNATLRISAIALSLAFVWHGGRVLVRWRAVMLALVIILFVVNGLSVLEFPRAQIDEGWDANVGWTFAHEGVLYTRLHQGIFGIPERFVPVANVLPAYWLMATGLGLLQARFLVFFGGLILLALTYRVTRLIYDDPNVALFAVAFLAASYIFFYSSHEFRLDIYVGVAGLAALYLFLRSTQRPILALFAGFILSASLEIHQSALAFCIGGALYLAGWVIVRSACKWRLSVCRRDVYFALGGVAGISLFVIFHVLPAPADFMQQLGTSMGIIRGDSPDLFSVLGPFAASLRATFEYSQRSPFEAVLVVVFCLLALRIRAARRYVLLLLAVFLGYGLVSGAIHFFYLINFWPLVVIICAGVLFSEIQRRSAFAFAICAAVAILPLAQVVGEEFTQTNRHAISIAAQINHDLAPGAKVVALDTYFLLMPNPPELITPFMAAYAQTNTISLQGAVLWEHLAPDVFILSPPLGEPPDPMMDAFRQQHGFVQVASYDQAGCCIVVYQGLSK